MLLGAKTLPLTNNTLINFLTILRLFGSDVDSEKAVVSCVLLESCYEQKTVEKLKVVWLEQL
jgi:hypothetical protein